jgi:hypothetical protein
MPEKVVTQREKAAAFCHGKTALSPGNHLSDPGGTRRSELAAQDPVRDIGRDTVFGGTDALVAGLERTPNTSTYPTHPSVTRPQKVRSPRL